MPFQDQPSDVDQAIAILQQLQSTGAFVGGGMVPNQAGLMEMGISALGELMTGSSAPFFLSMGPQNVPPSQRLYQRDVMAPIWQQEQQRILQSMGRNLGQDFASKLAVPLQRTGVLDMMNVTPEQFINRMGRAGGTVPGQIATALLMQQIGDVFGGTEMDLARGLEPMRFGTAMTGGRVLNPYAEEDVYMARQTMDIRRQTLQTAIKGKVDAQGNIIETLDPNIAFTRGFSERQIGEVATLLARRGTTVQDEQGRDVRMGTVLDPRTFTGPTGAADWEKAQQQLEQAGVQRVGQTMGVLKSVGDFLGMTAEQMPEIIKSLDAMQANWQRMPNLQNVERTFREIGAVADVVSRATGTTKQEFAAGMLRAGKVMSEAEGLGEGMQRFGFGRGVGGQLQYMAQQELTAGALVGVARGYGRDLNMGQAENVVNLMSTIGAQSAVGVDLQHMFWLRQQGRISEEQWMTVRTAATTGTSEDRRMAFDVGYRQAYGSTDIGRATAQNKWIQRRVDEETAADWVEAGGPQLMRDAQTASWRSMTRNELQRTSMAEQRLGSIGGPTYALAGRGMHEGMRAFFARPEARGLGDVQTFLEGEYRRARATGMDDTAAWQVAMRRAEDDPRMRDHMGQLRRDVAGATTEAMAGRFAGAGEQFRTRGGLAYLGSLAGTRGETYQRGYNQLREREQQAITADQQGNTSQAARLRGQLANQYATFVGGLDVDTRSAVRAVERDLDRQHGEQVRSNEATGNAMKLARQLEENQTMTKVDAMKQVTGRKGIVQGFKDIDLRTADIETINRLMGLAGGEGLVGTEREALTTAIRNRDQAALGRQLGQIAETTGRYETAVTKAAGEGANLAPNTLAAYLSSDLRERQNEIKAQAEEQRRYDESVPQTSTNLAEAIYQALPRINLTGVLTLVDKLGNVLATGSITGDQGAAGAGGGAGPGAAAEANEGSHAAYRGWQGD